jgi:hypothetical protein
MTSDAQQNGETPPGGAGVELVGAERGLGARLDRGAWAALSQPPTGGWSWSRAIITIVAAMACAMVIYLTIYSEPAFIVALAVVYVILVFRARTIPLRYGKSAGS